MSRTLRVAALAAAAVAAAPAASAQAHSSWNGYVINCLHGGPVPYAPVHVDSQGRSGRADAGGRFTFYNLADGSITVRATAVHGTHGPMVGYSAPRWLDHRNWSENIVIRPSNRGLCLPHLR